MSNVVRRNTQSTRLPKAYAYFCLYFGLLALALICLAWSPFALIFQALLPEQRARSIGRRGITQSFRLFLWILSGLGACRFDLSELDQLRDAGPMILAPNHPSLLDAVMVISRLPNIACIMKAELMGNLFLGAGARAAGYIPNKSPRAMIKAACRELGQGGQLLLFPEGTRTVRPPINPLVPATGAIARLAKVPIQTIIIETDSPFLAKGWPLFRCPDMPLHYRVRLGKRFDPPGDTQAMAATLEHYFANTLAEESPLG
ncbi:1-acyl-sn-glycerol-3-phosphate acyltransferase [Thiorhodococcus mannitoliphagus]|uniref:1-acyl-sn-glycerol-3-phosphate acyltransferase n=1 Tax=Thiorhodococcus mannitoliphagus TaxID=329406 RepID=A0A6P1DXC0_9GAMM|nr:lysophospholipid acyltransferase family protein [Thiorhodococcus mannitoliphagus]NEX21743.1 1-acyl-sn-glycerol-3-phosphate acyltransferase [Thiorhodococcus mannitoliphagus]